MEKQEIEKAIKNGESVWVANEYRYPYKVKLTNKHYVGVINDIKCLMLAFQNEDDELIDYLEYIFETKEKAQHYHDHANVSRTEHLPFLTWEEFDKGDNRIKFKSKNGDYCSLEGYFDKDTNYGFIDVVRNWHCVFSKDYTEANFYKAYDECVRLFKGE